MDRVAEPLGRMGARVAGNGRRGASRPSPSPAGPCTGIEYTPAHGQRPGQVGRPAGRYRTPTGETVVTEPVATRAYTEEMLAAAGADIAIESDGVGRVVRVRRSALECGAYTVPGDPSQAAFWLVGSVIIPGSLVTVTGVDLSIERLGFARGAPADGRHHRGRGGGQRDGLGDRLHRPAARHRGRGRRDPLPRRGARSWPWPRPPPPAPPGSATSASCGSRSPTAWPGRSSWSGPSGARPPSRGTIWWSRGRANRCRPGRVDARGDHRMAMAAAIAAAACPACVRRHHHQPDGSRWPPATRPSPTICPGSGPASGRPMNPARTGVAAHPVIAIDGPAGSGKSTVSRALADRLGIDRLDTGAMYRAVAWAVLDREHRRRPTAERWPIWPGRLDHHRRASGSRSTGPTSPRPSGDPR